MNSFKQLSRTYPKSNSQAFESGGSFPLGSTIYSQGVNFSLFCKNGTLVELLLFNDIEDVEPARVIRLDAKLNRTYFYWHVFVAGLQSGQLYAYRVHGPYDPAKGDRYNASKILIDPYGKAVAVPIAYERMPDIQNGRKTPSMKSVVADLSQYDWEDDSHPATPFAKTIIYEMHVGGFTRHPSANVDPQIRGTYSALIEKIPYLSDLGITAVELLPVFHFDELDCPEGLVNYWGYSPVSFFAPHQGYSSSKVPLDLLDEFRDMVKAFHRAGIEVILDVVFNHTAEGNQDGPTFCFKGIDNRIYYMLESDKSLYANYSGTGNTLNANHSIVRRMIIDSLHFWVTEMHVDGFRFDLASILARDENGMPIENPPVLWDIESDPVFAGIKLIAEAWDAAGLYQVGSFIGDSWKEWNGKFRDDVRSFLRGDNGTISKLVTRVVGSPDIYAHKEREPEQSINFVTCHDGFTLNDLVSYNNKHNEANKEQNRDGNNDNLSWNCGVEGKTDDTAIEILRNRQVKNFHVINILSVGTPMILMGDEVRRTQFGNNNAYCQDNEISWFDWNLPEKHSDLYQFVKALIHARLQRDLSRIDHGMNLSELLQLSRITWHGVKLNQPDWSHESHSIAFTVTTLSETIRLHYMINSFNESLEFELPSSGKAGSWKRWIDTSLDSPDDICVWGNGVEIKENKYKVQRHSCVILTALI